MSKLVFCPILELFEKNPNILTIDEILSSDNTSFFQQPPQNRVEQLYLPPVLPQTETEQLYILAQQRNKNHVSVCVPVQTQQHGTKRKDSLDDNQHIKKKVRHYDGKNIPLFNFDGKNYVTYYDMMWYLKLRNCDVVENCKRLKNIITRMIRKFGKYNPAKIIVFSTSDLKKEFPKNIEHFPIIAVTALIAVSEIIKSTSRFQFLVKDCNMKIDGNPTFYIKDAKNFQKELVNK